MATVQLKRRCEQLLTLLSLRTLFASVGNVEATHAQCLTCEVDRADCWLPQRLAR